MGDITAVETNGDAATNTHGADIEAGAFRDLGSWFARALIISSVMEVLFWLSMPAAMAFVCCRRRNRLKAEKLSSTKTKRDQLSNDEAAASAPAAAQVPAPARLDRVITPVERLLMEPTSGE